MSKLQKPTNMIYWLNNMNLANKITILRIILVPIVTAGLYFDFQYNDFVTAALFLITASTDTMDGYFARKRNEITKFGKFLDPLADKILVIAVLIALVELGRIPGWSAIIIISREVVVTGFRAVAASSGVVLAAGLLGKIKTTVQIIAIIAVILENFIFSIFGFRLDYALMYLAVVITIYSGFDYIHKNINIISEKI